MTTDLSPRRRNAAAALSNQDFILAAIAQCGGHTRAVHVEDIAVHAHKLAGDRFVWSLYPDQIDLEKVRSTIRFMSRSEGGHMVVGATREGWLLSRRGFDYVRSLADALPEAAYVDDKMAVEAERIRKHPAVVAQREGRIAQVSKAEIEDLFRPAGVNPNLSRAVLIERALNAVGDDLELKAAVEALARRF